VRKWDAYRVFLSLEGARALIFSMIFTASMVYQVTVAQLSPLQLVLVGTTLEASVFLFEVPTGVVADVYSRRLSIIIGMVLSGLGFLLEGSLAIFWTILLAQVLWGVGYTFTSGATEAWISDEIGETAAGQAFLRSSQIGQIAGLVGIGLGILLGNLQVNYPIMLGGLSLILLGIYLMLVMPEVGFKPMQRDERSSSWESMVGTFRQGLSTIATRPALKRILLIGLIYGLYSEGFDRLWTKHLLDDFQLPGFGQLDLQPVVWIGLVRAIGMLLSAGAAGIARRKIVIDSHRQVARALFWITSALAISLFSFSLVNSLILALVIFWVIAVSRTVIGPVFTAWVNQRLDSSVRATVISMSGQVDAIGQIAGGPVVGWVGNVVSVRTALAVSSFIITPAVALLHGASKQDDPIEDNPGSSDASE
jgi:DHA3 family tetracycline resistance protein-like MFS transporter